MARLALTASLGFCLCQYAYGISSISTATVAAPLPDQTYCPQYDVKPRQNHDGFTCGERGSLKLPSQISQLCSTPEYGYTTYDVLDCYRRCTDNPKCVTFGFDDFTRQCTLYDKNLEAQRFEASEKGMQVFYNLRGCFHCDAPKLPTKLHCPEYTGDGMDPQPGYICHTQGYNTDKRTFLDLAASDGDDEFSCYNLCVQLDSVGKCTAYAFGLLYGEQPTCRIFNTTLRELGFKPGNRGLIHSNLRGCYACNITPPANPNPKPTCPGLGLKNGDFSKTTFNSKLGFLQPAHWNPTRNVQSVKLPNGNICASINGTHQGDNAAMQQTVTHFRDALRDPGRFYNVTFDLALTLNQHPSDPGKAGCMLELISFGTIYFDASSPYGPAFKTVGPFGIDGNYFGSAVGLGFFFKCYNNANGTVLIDNIVFSQHGRAVAVA